MRRAGNGSVHETVRLADREGAVVRASLVADAERHRVPNPLGSNVLVDVDPRARPLSGEGMGVQRHEPDAVLPVDGRDVLRGVQIPGVGIQVHERSEGIDDPPTAVERLQQRDDLSAVLGINLHVCLV